MGTQFSLWRDHVFAWIQQLSLDSQALMAMLDRLSLSDSGMGLLRLIVLVMLVSLALRVMRQLGVRFMHRLDAWTQVGAREMAPPRRILSIALVLGLNAAKVAVAVALGYLFTVLAFIASDGWARAGSDFLAAFIVVELWRLALATFVEPNAPTARLLPLTDQAAHYWYRLLSRLIRLTGYGLLFIVPVIGRLAQSYGVLAEVVILAAALWGFARILKRTRAEVRAWLIRVSARRPAGVITLGLRLLAPIWHSVVGVYALGLAVIAVLAPDPALQHVVINSAISLATVLGAGFVGHWVGLIAQRASRVRPALKARVPMLEARLNAWVPKVLWVIHALLAALIAAVLAELWGLINVQAWAGSALGQTLIASVLGLLSIGFLALIAWLLAVSWIEDRLNPDTGQGEPGAREKTLLALFRNAIAIAIVTLGGMVALAEVGIDIGPLIAGAGVIGLAIGFGAQKLVQDIITGVFIQLEDAIHQDDFITAAGISGTVERLSIRSLGLRDLYGTLHVIPFSSVDTVSNFTRDFGYHLGEYGVAYRENIGDVVEHLQRAYARLIADTAVAEAVTGALEVDGVTALADSAVNVRVRIRTVAGMQWAVGRAYNRVVKEVFDEAGIEIPFPHMTLYFGEDKAGSAPPAHIALTQQSKD